MPVNLLTKRIINEAKRVLLQKKELEDKGCIIFDHNEHGFSGYKTLVFHADAKIENKQLFVNDFLIYGYDNSFESKIPKFYIARNVKEASSTNRRDEFICGVDLLENNQVWVGINGGKYDDFKSAWEQITKKYSNAQLFLEEPMSL
jgi:hypothetical protein